MEVERDGYQSVRLVRQVLPYSKGLGLWHLAGHRWECFDVRGSLGQNIGRALGEVWYHYSL